MVIPTLPVLVPATGVAVAVTLGRLHRRGGLTVPRAVVAVAACVYAAGVLAHVLLPMTVTADDPRPWRVWLHLTPFVDVMADPSGVVLNAALFVPLGLLLPLLLRAATLRRVVGWGFALSLVIETVQLLGALTVAPGRVTDVDDLIGNTVGTLLGYAAYSVLVTVPALAGLARRAALPPTPRACAIS